MNSTAPYTAAAITIPLAFAIVLSASSLSEYLKAPSYPKKIEIVNINVNDLNEDEKKTYFEAMKYTSCLESYKEMVIVGNRAFTTKEITLACGKGE